MTAYTVIDARGKTVLPASAATTAALYCRIFNTKHGEGSHRVVAVEPALVAAPLGLAAGAVTGTLYFFRLLQPPLKYQGRSA